MRKTLIVILLCLIFYPYFSKAQEKRTQTVKGTIIDKNAKTPIPGVNVILLGTDSLKGAASDRKGFFKIENIPLGRHAFQFTCIGYEPVYVRDILVNAGKEVVLNISMTESIYQLDQFVVTYDRSKDRKVTNNDMAAVSARPFSMDETKRYAGSLGDPARMAANFAGVVSSNDTRNDILIRGNGSSGMLWKLEGLNIPNPNHFGATNSMGGAVSMLNSNNLSKSDFLTGAFPAQYGNAIAGVFDMKMREGNHEKSEFLAQMGFNGFEAGLEGPITGKGKASYLVNGRYSTLALFQDLGLNFGTGSATPVYADINYKISTPVGKKTKLSVFGIWGRSSIDILGTDYDTTKIQTYGSPNWNNYPRYHTNITGINVERQLGSKTHLDLTFGYSRTDENFKRDSISTENENVTVRSQEWRFTTDKYSGVARLYHKINAGHSLVAGLTEDIIDYSLFWKRIYGGTREQIRVDQKGQHYITQAFIQWRYWIARQLILVSGLHYQYLYPNGSWSLEPRIGLTFRITPSHKLGIGFGSHSQMQNVITYSVVTPTPEGNMYTNKSLDFTKSRQHVLSHDWRITGDLHIKTELYYQNLFNIPVTQRPGSYAAINVNAGNEFIPSYEDSLVNEGTGRNFGAEITIEKYFNNQYYYLITASLFDSKYRGSDGILRNTSYNMGRVLNVLAGKEFRLGNENNILTVSIKSTWTGGRYITPIDFEASKKADRAIYQEDKAFSIQQRDYFRTDLKFAYRKEFDNSTLEISLDLQNITNNKNIFSQGWDRRNNRVTTNYQQGFFPVPFVRFIF